MTKRKLIVRYTPKNCPKNEILSYTHIRAARYRVAKKIECTITLHSFFVFRDTHRRLVSTISICSNVEFRCAVTIATRVFILSANIRHQVSILPIRQTIVRLGAVFLLVGMWTHTLQILADFACKQSNTRGRHNYLLHHPKIRFEAPLQGSTPP